MIGQTISHYKILEKLGEGGMGIVYKAEDTKLKRTVALKFLPPEFTRDKDAKERFFVEAQAAAALEHQNICNIYEIEEAEDQIFIVMSYVEGQNLKEKIESGPLQIKESLKIAIQIAEGLQEAHEKGIVHRDIKSANIMITEKGQVKIMDFGLAKLKGKSKLTKAGTTVGTAAYMSPEQSMGKKVDHRTDIWSLGVVLYEMVTGQLPFKGDYEQAVVYSILNEEPEPVTAIRTGIPQELERIINKTLVKDPSDRYQHADDMMVDLRKFKKDSKPEVTVSKKKTSPEITLKASRKMLILGSIFIVVIIIVGYFIFKGKPESEMPVIEPDEKPSIAIIYFENNSGDESLDNWRSALAELIITDLSQSRYIRVLPGDRIFSIFKKLNLLEAKKYSTDDLKAIANQGRVNHILNGSYIKAGENFVITSMLQNVSTGEIVSSLKVEARGAENIFSKVDELTKKIKLNLNLSRNQIDSDLDKDVGKITTSSPEAYQYFLKASELYRKGDNRKAIPLFEKAISVDPEFAMAYRNLGACYGNIGNWKESRKYYKKAFDLADQVSDRERYRIQGNFYLKSEKTFDKAIEAFTKLLQLYPDDWYGNNLLGFLYMILEEWDQAIKYHKVNIQNKSEIIHPYENICVTYQAKGMYEEAQKVLEDYLNNFQDNFVIRTHLANNYGIQRKFDLALSEIEKACALNSSDYWPFLVKGDIYLYQGDFKKAEKAYRMLLESEEKTAQLWSIFSIGCLQLVQGKFADAELQFKRGVKKAKEYGFKGWQASSHQFIGYMYLLSRKYEEAINEFTKTLTIFTDLDDPLGQVWSLHFKAITLLEMKSSNRAQEAEDELLKCINKQMNKKLIRWYYLYQGQKEMKKKQYSKAIEHFNHALSLLPSQNYNINFVHALFIDPLAFAYFKSGSLEKAQKEYEKITTLTIGRWYFGDIYAKAFYQLGKIYEQIGPNEKAIECYNKFIELWKDCDPQFQPLVEDARKGVKELEGKK
jgi:serine/threonine protein kinase/Flp pilus assembly protein TadD